MSAMERTTYRRSPGSNTWGFDEPGRDLGVRTTALQRMRPTLGSNGAGKRTAARAIAGLGPFHDGESGSIPVPVGNLIRLAREAESRNVSVL
jgi:hypothetical protein